MVNGLENKLEVFGTLRREATFKVYNEILASKGVYLLEELISRLKQKQQVTFYDLGCGLGKAGDDIFDMVESALVKEGENPLLVGKLIYLGIDIIPPEGAQTKAKRFVEYDLERLDEIMHNLPKIDVGLCFWVFPYIERKMESLEHWVSHLSKDGKLIIFPFHEDLTIVTQDGSQSKKRDVYLECFDMEPRDRLRIITGSKKPVASIVHYRESDLYHLPSFVKNSRFPQIVSYYGANSTQMTNS